MYNEERFIPGLFGGIVPYVLGVATAPLFFNKNNCCYPQPYPNYPPYGGGYGYNYQYGGFYPGFRDSNNEERIYYGGPRPWGFPYYGVPRPWFGGYRPWFYGGYYPFYNNSPYFYYNRPWGFR